MILKKLTIHNFKSLRNVCFEPGPLSVLVGANASGKTNFARAIQFLAEVYSLGLEVAVSRAGGYENIAHRKQRRSKESIKFEIEVNGTMSEIAWGISQRNLSEQNQATKKPISLKHKFAINVVGTGIKAAFRVVEESIRLVELEESSNGEYLEILREKDGQIKDNYDKSKNINKLFPSFARMRKQPTLFGDVLDGREIQEQSLIVEHPVFRVFSRSLSLFISKFKAYRVSPEFARQPGVPTPNPILSTKGENLPAIVDWLQSSRPKEWEIIIEGMQDVLPGLEEISVDYLHTKTLGLFFNEAGVGRAWAAEDVSDGTILALALLVASVDPRSSLILFDELENSLHPWVLRTVVKRLRQVSKNKLVIVTTHSPILVDMLRPEEVWVVYRKDGESHVQKLTDIEPSITQSWEGGEFTLSSYLDSGSIGQAVPGGVF